MKKNIKMLLLIIILLVIISGCTKKTTNWEINKGKTGTIYNEEEKESINKAIKDYKKEKFEVIAQLGEQVVSGKNYMYLCRSKDDLKVVIVYKDLKGNSKITKVKDFNIEDYADKDISYYNEAKAGGWQTSIQGKPIMLEENIQNAFDDATEKIIGTTYYPVYVLGTNKENKNKYIILSYGRVSDANSSTGVYIITLEINEESSIIDSIAAIDLKKFNK